MPPCIFCFINYSSNLFAFDAVKQTHTYISYRLFLKISTFFCIFFHFSPDFFSSFLFYIKEKVILFSSNYKYKRDNQLVISFIFIDYDSSAQLAGQVTYKNRAV